MKSLSFPHALSGNPDETAIGCPIKTFGHDNFGIGSKSSSKFIFGLCNFAKFKFILNKSIWISLILFNAVNAHAVDFTTNGVRLKKAVKPLREIKRDHVISQSLDFSCGTAGLSTLLNYYLGDPVTEAEIIETLLNMIPLEKVRARGGFSLYDLKRYAQDRGYEATGYQMDIDFLQKLHKPVLVPIKFKNYRHFVIVRGVIGDRVFIADPAAGNMSMKIDKFMTIWTNGVGLVIENKQTEGEAKSLDFALTVDTDDFVISDYKSIRRITNTDLIQTAIHPTEW